MQTNQYVKINPLIMKKSAPFLALIASAVLFSCTQGGNNSTEQADSLAKAKLDTVLHKECFIAIDETDTATLSLNTHGTDKVTGHLLIKYATKDKNDGELKGSFKGDTLFVDYTFKVGDDKVVHKNPLAFLKKDGKLILGVGVIETTLGRSYFAKDKPINFERGKFTFDPVACKE